MTLPGPFGGDDPSHGMPPFMRDLAKLFTQQGPLNWELARQMAVWVASEGATEPNPDPLERIRLEELARVAELHVADVTGLQVSATGAALRVRAVTRAEWAAATLDAWRPVFEALARALAASSEAPLGAPPEAEGDDPFGGLLGNLQQVIGPFLAGMQVGTLVGYLGRRAFGQYEIPIPRPASDELVLVPSTITAFASDWSLDADDVRMWLVVSEVAHHAVLNRPHVRDRLDKLLVEHASAFRIDGSSIEEKLGEVDPTNPASFQELFGGSDAVLGAITTPEQESIAAELAALVSVVEGFVDHVLDTIGRKLVGGFGAITEALRRRRIEEAESDRFVEGLLGLRLDRAQFDRGYRFVAGVIDRAGVDGLTPLWLSDRHLPTPAEVDAPGLWIARLELPLG